MIEPIDLETAFASFHEHWSPRLAATVNDFEVRLAKLQGEFVWHRHAEEDELFLVVKGRLELRLRDGAVVLGPGQLAVVPRGVEHQPFAAEEAWVLLLERGTTRNTGDVTEARTVERPAPLPPSPSPPAAG